jgi:hypothetical protein
MLALAVATLVLLGATGAASENAEEIVVATGQQLLQALREVPGITAIRVMADLAVQPELWTGPLEVDRKLTIYGGLGARTYPSLDFNYWRTASGNTSVHPHGLRYAFPAVACIAFYSTAAVH